ncbi:MAG: exonuclease sbcCD subunit D [Candidatus Angelobacter sp. Gp1-AA117]|nr:MAG: exonuclease sbcCD subunit D [Candidatus Angelobacter sp. Gp1-AA117]
MRILHTADWHAGKTLWNRSRVPEQEKVYAEIVDIARREKVHLALIAGDVFETNAPSPDAERLVYGALAEMIGAGIPVVVVGGNHDNPKRLAALREMLAPLNIFVRAEPQRPEAGGVIEIRAGNELARIAVLPWVADQKLIDICQLMGPEDEWYTTYSENVAAMCRRLAQSFSPDTVNILAAHLFAFGAETSGSERAIHVAQPLAVSPSRFPTTAQYIALGHIHKPQEITCPTRGCYAGSPLQLDFGERGQQKRVVLVDVEAGQPASIDSIPLASGRQLREITGSVEELKNQAGAVRDDFLKLIVKTETQIPGIADELREIFPNALEVRVQSAQAAETVAEISGSKPLHEHFADFFRQSRGLEPAQEILNAFHTLELEVANAADQT